MRNAILLLVLLLVLQGCAFKRFSENMNGLDETDKPFKSHTADTSLVVWPPFSKTGPVAHGLKYTWGGKENEIISGQDTEAVDTTGQTEAINAVGSIVGQITSAAIQYYMNKPASPGGTSNNQSGALGYITTVAELLQQLQALGILKPKGTVSP